MDQKGGNLMLRVATVAAAVAGRSDPEAAFFERHHESGVSSFKVGTSGVTNVGEMVYCPTLVLFNYCEQGLLADNLSQEKIIDRMIEGYETA